MADRLMPTCDKPIGRKPYWMGVDQWEPCLCLREPNHKGVCRCEHMTVSEQLLMDSDLDG